MPLPERVNPRAEERIPLRGKRVEHDQTAKIFLNPEDPRTEDYIAGRYGLMQEVAPFSGPQSAGPPIL
jgi:hypothetical protein